jgi:hypothetical protein
MVITSPDRGGEKMDKRSWLLFIFFSLLVWMAPLNTYAQSELNGREKVFNFLEEAFEAQVSLSEEGRTMAEIGEILDPYFTGDYKTKFIKENVVGQENDYMTYGTDFAPYYIPFYAFSEETKVVDMGNEIYVLEYFPGNGEGPVSYENHYEGLKLVKEKGSWKVADYMYDNIPEEVIKKAYPEKNKNEKNSAAAKQEINAYPQNLVYGPNFSSLKTFMEFGVMFGSESKTLLFGLL